jgi:uncharacterized protein (DUF4415 family)
MKGTATRTLTKSVEQVRAARMTPEQQARFDAMTADDIDYSDIPDQGGRTDWTRPGITLYVDTDIARYFRTKNGLSLDSERINQVLREYIAAHPKV